MAQTPELGVVATPPPTPAPLARPGTTPATIRGVQRTQLRRRPLGQILTEMGAVSPADLLKALNLRGRRDARLGDILLANGWVREPQLMEALARQWRAAVVDLAATPPDPRLIDALSPELCLREAMVPWQRIGEIVVIATARPDHFERLRSQLPAEFGPYRMVIASEQAVHDSLLALRQTALIRRAESRVPAQLSCRLLDERRAARLAWAIAAITGIGLWQAPALIIAILFGWAMVTLITTVGLRLAATLAMLTRPSPSPGQEAANPVPLRLPAVSLMVPLLHERDIAERLVARLSRLDYPRELLDILLIVEEHDQMTRAALAGAVLPNWMRIVVVPEGPIHTKPRALNYALNFCRGSIIGVYDAEDMPDPDQIQKVVRRFAECAPEVACLQGALDYYNPRTNWLARCFTVEYAAWFRAMLPGIARLGLAVPLGGTTLFFRRQTLEELGGWDAHNVTEDADLGIRLARFGYRTELLDTTTHEEANCRALPWVRQRSRWLKGYAITWRVHMRSVPQLWRDLGPWRFLGMQIMFIGTLTQYLLAPLLWSCWIMILGLPHPLQLVFSDAMFQALLWLFISTELINIAISAWAVRSPEHRHLMIWVPTLHFYFPLGALAGWKAIYEVVTRPFYWDKTAHGLFDHAEALAHVTRAPAPS